MAADTHDKLCTSSSRMEDSRTYEQWRVSLRGPLVSTGARCTSRKAFSSLVGSIPTTSAALLQVLGRTLSIARFARLPWAWAVKILSPHVPRMRESSDRGSQMLGPNFGTAAMAMSPGLHRQPPKVHRTPSSSTNSCEALAVFNSPCMRFLPARAKKFFSIMPSSRLAGCIRSGSFPSSLFCSQHAERSLLPPAIQ
jgi:hypothetical protein